MTLIQCPSETDAAYLAGVLDSDGSIGLTEFHDYNEKYGKTYRGIHPFVSVVNRDGSMLQWIRDSFGKGWKWRKAKRPKWRHVYQWQVDSRRDCKHILEPVLPYLKIKRRQAEIVLDFCSNHVSHSYSAKDWVMLAEIKSLNKRGD